MRDLLDHLGVAASGTAGFSFSFSFFGAAGTVALAGTALPVKLRGTAGRHLTPKNPSSQVSLPAHWPRQGSASHSPVFSLHCAPCWPTGQHPPTARLDHAAPSASADITPTHL